MVSVTLAPGNGRPPSGGSPTTESLQTPDRAVRIATDLVNTCVNGTDSLREPGDLRHFLLEHAEPEPVSVTTRDLEQMRAVRERLRAVYAPSRDADAAEVINGLLADHATRPYLSEHDGTPWHVHVTTLDAGWARWAAATTAMALATLVAGHGFDALRVCAAADCDRAFVTTAPRRTRRFCSSRCATRTRVDAYRARQRSTSPSDAEPA